MIARAILGLLLIIVLGVLAGCAPTNVAGTGTETSTKNAALVQGRIIDAGGNPVAGVCVFLLPADFNPITDSIPCQAMDTTGGEGGYSVRSKEPGRYNLQAQANDGLLLIPGILAEPGATLAMPDAVIRRAGFLRLYPAPASMPAGGRLYVPGTTLQASVAADSVILAPLPAGVALPLYYAGAAAPHAAICIDSAVHAASGDTARLFFAAMIAGSADTLPRNDSLIIDAIRAAGGKVRIIGQGSAAAASFGDVNLIVISSTCTPAIIDTVFRHTPLPAVVCEMDLYAGMRMTPDSAGSGYQPNQLAIDFLLPSHWISGGLSGEITVFSAPSFVSWGIAAPGAAVIAGCKGLPGKAALFCYETNAQMIGMRAPARRVGFFIDVYSAVLSLNDTGWQLFRRSLWWALGGG